MAFEEFRLRFNIDDPKQRQLFETLSRMPKGQRSERIRDILYEGLCQGGIEKPVLPEQGQPSRQIPVSPLPPAGPEEQSFAPVPASEQSRAVPSGWSL